MYLGRIHDTRKVFALLVALQILLSSNFFCCDFIYLLKVAATLHSSYTRTEVCSVDNFAQLPP